MQSSATGRHLRFSCLEMLTIVFGCVVLLAGKNVYLGLAGAGPFGRSQADCFPESHRMSSSVMIFCGTEVAQILRKRKPLGGKIHQGIDFIGAPGRIRTPGQEL